MIAPLAERVTASGLARLAGSPWRIVYAHQKSTHGALRAEDTPIRLGGSLIDKQPVSAIEAKPEDWGQKITTVNKMQPNSEDLKPLLYLRNLLTYLFEKPEKYNVTPDEVSELRAAADKINEILHRVRGIAK